MVRYKVVKNVLGEGNFMRKAELIYNPVSGKEQAQQYIDEITSIIAKAGFSVQTFETTPEEKSAQKEAERAALAGIDMIIAMGGDGTVHEVVNGIAGLKKRPILGIIPMGTTNDYARALNLPRNNPIEAAQVIANQNNIAMDMGKFNDTYFVNIAAGGYMTDLTYEVSSEMKTRFGYFAYVIKGVQKAFQMQPIQMKFEYDGGSFEGEASMFFVALTNSIGGFEKMVPDSHMMDGKFSVLVVKTANLLDIIPLIRQMMLSGDHINSEHIHYFKTDILKVTAVDGHQLMINVDGEYGGDAPAVFVNLQQHIEICSNLEDVRQIEKNKTRKDHIRKLFNQELAFLETQQFETIEDNQGNREEENHE